MVDATIIAKRKYLARERIGEVAARLGEGPFSDGVKQLRAALADGKPLDSAHNELHNAEALAAISELVAVLVASNEELASRVVQLEERLEEAASGEAGTSEASRKAAKAKK